MSAGHIPTGNAVVQAWYKAQFEMHNFSVGPASMGFVPLVNVAVWLLNSFECKQR